MFTRTRDDSTSQLPKPDPHEDRWNPSLRNWFERSDERVVQRNNAVKVAFAALGVAVLAFVAMFSQMGQPKLVPYLVTVQTNTRVIDGRAQTSTQAVSLAQPAAADKELLNRAVQFEVKTFIESVRTVTFDTQYERDLLIHRVKPYLLPGSEALDEVDSFLHDNDPNKRAQRGSVEVISDEPIPQTDTTYEVHWFEVQKTQRGLESGRTEWRGFVTVELHEVEVSSLLDNPLGIYVRNVTWQQVGLNATAPPAATP